MGKVLEFFVAMPKLCGARNADRWADIIAYQYNREIEGGSVFDRNEDDAKNPENRMETAFAFSAKDDGAKEQCKRLARIIMYSHYLNEHGEAKYQKMIDNEYTMAKAAESAYPEIASVMSADEAVASWWDGV